MLPIANFPYSGWTGSPAAKGPRAARCAVDGVHAHSIHVCDLFQDEFSDAVPVVNRESFVTAVDEDDLDFAAVVVVNHASQNVDAELESQAGCGCDAAVSAGGHHDDDARADDHTLVGRDDEVIARRRGPESQISVQIKASGASGFLE